jgi:hypothetical protein
MREPPGRYLQKKETLRLQTMAQRITCLSVRTQGMIALEARIAGTGV